MERKKARSHKSQHHFAYNAFVPCPQEYDPELFSKALPCLTAISCALPPDYSLTEGQDDDWCKQGTHTSGPYVPEPVNTSG